jgi:hypothetical protein
MADASAAADCAGFRRALLKRRAKEELLETFPAGSCPRPAPIPKPIPGATTVVEARDLSLISGRVGDSLLPFKPIPGAGKLSKSAS